MRFVWAFVSSEHGVGGRCDDLPVGDGSLSSEFADRGVVRLDGAFSAVAAARIADIVWGYANRRVGVVRAEPSSWSRGWLPISWKGLKRNRAFDVFLDNPSVVAAFDAIFGPETWTRPKPGVQVLFSLPGAGPWTMPDGWHMDCGFEQPAWPVPAVKAFGFFGDVGPCGGGTLLLAGSHRLVDAYRSASDEPPGGGKANWQQFLRRHPPLGDLLTAGARSDHGRSLVGERFDVEGVPIEVLELTGRPGDVVLTHLHVFHCASPNTTDVPRQMLAKTVPAGRLIHDELRV
jgi:hypothetical protein